MPLKENLVRLVHVKLEQFFSEIPLKNKEETALDMQEIPGFVL